MLKITNTQLVSGTAGTQNPASPLNSHHSSNIYQTPAKPTTILGTRYPAVNKTGLVPRRTYS